MLHSPPLEYHNNALRLHNDDNTLTIKHLLSNNCKVQSTYHEKQTSENIQKLIQGSTLVSDQVAL